MTWEKKNWKTSAESASRSPSIAALAGDQLTISQLVNSAVKWPELSSVSPTSRRAETVRSVHDAIVIDSPQLICISTPVNESSIVDHWGQVIDAISDAIRAVGGVSLLDVDAGASTNRTVYTFVGSPESVVAAALQAARVAFKLIDMSKHSGEK